jgi:electron transfer flavoprotein alpha subunit
MKIIFNLENKKMIKIDESLCIGCSACVDVCPVEALSMKNTKAVVSDACIDCGACISACPVDAIGS